MIHNEKNLAVVKSILRKTGVTLVNDAFQHNRIGQLQQLPMSTSKKKVEFMMHTLDGFHYQEGYESVLMIGDRYPVIISQDFTDPLDFFIVLGFAEPVISDLYYMTYVMNRGKALRDLVVVTGFGEVEVADGYNISFNNNIKSGVIDIKDAAYAADFFLDTQGGTIKHREEMGLSKPDHAKLNQKRG
jgi:hypothetical protein